MAFFVPAVAPTRGLASTLHMPQRGGTHAPTHAHSGATRRCPGGGDSRGLLGSRGQASRVCWWTARRLTVARRDVP